MKNGKLNARRIIGAVLHGCVLLAAAFGAACSDGSQQDDVCATYGCVNGALLTGSVALAEGVTLVDVQLCAEGQCHRGALDLRTPDTGEQCLRWGFHSHVCLTPSVTPGTAAVDALAEFASDAPPMDVSFQLVLTDRSTGHQLLDETRTAKHEITRQDSCHRCWQASASL
ncbi:MAG: hypothetical protein ABUL62_01320 [Myxococcales bacterium]|jgi:hypothetical protein